MQPAIPAAAIIAIAATTKRAAQRWCRKSSKLLLENSSGSGPANLATIRAAITAAIQDAGYLHIPEGQRDHTTPAETLRLHGLN